MNYWEPITSGPMQVLFMLPQSPQVHICIGPTGQTSLKAKPQARSRQPTQNACLYLNTKKKKERERKKEKQFRSGRSVHCRKMDPVFVSILLTCVFLLVGKIFFNDFVNYVFCDFELVFFSFFYSYYSKFRPFHCDPDFLDILCYDLFEFGVLLDC
ncbi:hypothetical protein STEG23_016966 [Scotinomys teguina]